VLTANHSEPEVRLEEIQPDGGLLTLRSLRTPFPVSLVFRISGISDFRTSLFPSFDGSNLDGSQQLLDLRPVSTHTNFVGGLHMATPTTPPSPALTAIELEFLKLQTKYLWDIWEFHGRQRMSMFYYFVIVAGILVNGYLMVLKEVLIPTGVLPPICVLGVFVCFAFLMIEIRNRNMLYYADDLLRTLEKDYFFNSAYKDLGPLTRRVIEEDCNWWFRNSKMKYWIPATYLTIMLGFLICLADSVWLLRHKHIFMSALNTVC